GGGGPPCAARAAPAGGCWGAPAGQRHFGLGHRLQGGPAADLLELDQAGLVLDDGRDVLAAALRRDVVERLLDPAGAADDHLEVVVAGLPRLLDLDPDVVAGGPPPPGGAPEKQALLPGRPAG